MCSMRTNFIGNNSPSRQNRHQNWSSDCTGTLFWRNLTLETLCSRRWPSCLWFRCKTNNLLPPNQTCRTWGLCCCSTQKSCSCPLRPSQSHWFHLRLGRRKTLPLWPPRTQSYWNQLEESRLESVIVDSIRPDQNCPFILGCPRFDDQAELTICFRNIFASV